MLRVRDIMTEEVLTLEPEMNLREAVDLLGGRHLSGAPVVTGDRVVGVVSQSDILSFQASTPGVPSHREEDDWDAWGPPDALGDEDDDVEDAPAAFFVSMWGDPGVDAVERFSQADSPEWNLLEEHTVSEVMTRRVLTVAPEASVREVATLMMGAGIHRVLVVSGQRLAGIVSTTDLVRAVADGRLVDCPE